MRDDRVSIAAYWAACSTARKLELAQASELSVEYLRGVAAGRQRVSRLAAISIVQATAGAVRPYSLRPDLWPYSAHLPPECITALETWRRLRRDLSQLTSEA